MQSYLESKTKYTSGDPPSCEELEESENFKWKYMSSPGIEPATPRFPRLKPLDHADGYGAVV